MRRLLLLLVLISTHFAVVGVAHAAEVGPFQFDNVIYSPPTGWEKGRTEEQYVVLYDDERGSYHYLRLYRSRPLPTDIETWLTDFAKKDVEDDEVFDKVISTRTIRVGRTDCKMLAVSVRDRRDEGRIYIAMHVGDRLELLRFEGPAGDEAEIRKTVTTFGRLADDFLSSLRFVSKGTPPLLGEPKPGPLKGVYYGIRFQVGVDGMMESRTHFYVFDESGRFLDAMIDGVSTNAPDFDAILRDHPNDGGNYEVRGGQIHFTYADGETDEDDFQLDEEVNHVIGRPSIRLNGTWLAPLDPPADGTRLDQTFSSLFVHSTGFGDNSSSVSGGRSITLGKNGRFETSGFTSVNGSAEMGDARTTWAGHNKRPDRGGTYAIKDGLITLTFDDGEVQARSILLASDSLLYLDGSQFLDRSKD